MAVLVEAISVIVRKRAIEERISGGWNRFVASVPNGTLCHDDGLARVGFMHPADVQAFVQLMESSGLHFVRDNVCVDLAVADQRGGPTLAAPWLEFAKLRIGSAAETVSACWLYEGSRDFGAGLYMPDTTMSLAVPEGWRYDESLSAQSQFVPTGEIPERLQFQRTEDGCDVFLNLETGEEQRVARNR